MLPGTWYRGSFPKPGAWRNPDAANPHDMVSCICSSPAPLMGEGQG